MRIDDQAEVEDEEVEVNKGGFSAGDGKIEKVVIRWIIAWEDLARGTQIGRAHV